MSNTAVSICSNALLMLGAQTINSFTDSADLDRAKLCANLYPSNRDQLLRAHPWNCAVKRLILSPDATPPAFGYSQQFQLPADCLRVMEVGEGGCQIDYRIEGRKIQANTSVLELRYVYRNEVENTWDDQLVNLMTMLMAARLAYAVTQSTSMEQSRLQEFERALRVAKAIDGQEEPPQTLGDFPLLQARYGGGW
ncbi:hypothetical protein [Pseudomonas sp.]|uniref:hypothetical protein n=1 Tax=Pseudomonas sp. TaxID=306 RepID=UPI00257B4406|nr:hypothetical protein [Pseudomonas sp.]